MKISGHHEANRWMDVKVEGMSGEILMAEPVTGPSATRGWLKRSG
jgi:hypothetical protein